MGEGISRKPLNGFNDIEIWGRYVLSADARPFEILIFLEKNSRFLCGKLYPSNHQTDFVETLHSKRPISADSARPFGIFKFSFLAKL